MCTSLQNNSPVAQKKRSNFLHYSRNRAVSFQDQTAENKAEAESTGENTDKVEQKDSESLLSNIEETESQFPKGEPKTVLFTLLNRVSLSHCTLETGNS